MIPTAYARSRLMGVVLLLLALCLGLAYAGPAGAQAAPAPSVTLTVTRADVVGYVPLLNWTTTGVTSCVAGGGWSGAKAASGTERLPAITVTTEFTLTCQGPAGSAFAEWIAPTQRTDGSPVTIVRHRLFHGTASGTYGTPVEVPMPATSVTVTGLAQGLRYFAVKAVADDGLESDFSAEVSHNVTTAKITGRATLTVAPPPKPPTGLRVVAVVAGLTANPVYSVAGDGSRGTTILGFVPVGTPCEGPRLFTYRGMDYHAMPPSLVQWWASAPTARNAAACGLPMELPDLPSPDPVIGPVPVPVIAANAAP